MYAILKMLIIFILLNIFMPIKSVRAILNEAKFENISIDEGLSNENVTSIFQDSRGYMWIGTKDGLNKYDGQIIKIYNCNVKSENTLSSTYIMDIEEDVYGNIWIATDNGLDFLMADTGVIVRMKDRKDKYNLGELSITSLIKSKYDENIMWVGTENGLMKIDVRNNSIQTFYHDPSDLNSLTNSSITCLEEGEDILWVGTKQGLNIIDKDLKVKSNRSNSSKDKLFISNMSMDKDGNLWLSTKEGIFIYNIKEERRDYIYIIDSDSIKEYNITKNAINNIYEFGGKKVKFYNNYIFNDSNNNIWISTSNGVIRYSSENEKFDILKKDEISKNSISSNIITCIYEDFNGTIWIGTDKGVNILNENIIFKSVNKYDNNAVAMLRHNDYIWIGTKFHGIYIYDYKTSELVNILYEEENFNLKDRYIRSMFEINNKYILAVTNKELIYFDTEENSYSEILIGDDYYSELSYMYSDWENIWIATTTDFYSYNISSGEKTYYSENMKEFGINPGNIKYILQDNKDEDIIWLGGVNIGLIKYHKQNGVMDKYVRETLNENSLINDYINCMVFDSSDNLWIGTNIGLSKFNLKTNEFTSYTTADGLTNNFINSILVDDNGDIWISTNKGLNKFDIEEEVFTNFTKMDGLHAYQFNLNSSLKLDCGYIMFASTEGITYFNPSELKDYKTYNNEVVIGDIYVGKNKVVYDGDELVLEHNYKNLYISYFLPNYERINSITYEYMLEGFDSDWIYIDSRNQLDFKYLESGTYTLKIRARDGQGKKTKETSIKIRVKNPIWKTTLAYIIYISIIIALFICIFNYVKILRHLVNQKTIKLNKQLEQNKILSQKIIDNEKFKNNYFINLSHELRTPINVINSTVQLINSINVNKGITYEKLNQYMEIIGKICNNLLKIINDIIDSSKIETGKYKINKKNYDIVYIVEETALNMRKFIEDKGISLIIDPEIEEKIISCDETEIERCIINLLGNAVKFTQEGGEIRVYIKEVENNIEITIEDTGIGISKEDQEFIFKRFEQVEGTKVTKVSSSGIGLTLVKYIIELHGGYIRLESEINKGSRFTIGLPDIVEKLEDN